MLTRTISRIKKSEEKKKNRSNCEEYLEDRHNIRMLNQLHCRYLSFYLHKTGINKYIEED